MTLALLALVVLGVYRLSYLVTIENGPLGMFASLREFVGSRVGWDSWIAQGIQCPLCLSFWLSLGAALAVPHQAFALGLIPGWVLLWLGMAGAALVLHLALHRR